MKIQEKIMEFIKGFGMNLVILGILNLFLAYTTLLPYGSLSWGLVILVAITVGLLDVLTSGIPASEHWLASLSLEFTVNLIALVGLNMLLGTTLFMEYGKLTLEFVVVVALIVAGVKKGIDRIF